MATIPATLQGFSVFVDGTGYVGRITKGTPPKLTKSLLEHRAGMPGMIDLFRGYEKMECQFAIREFNADIVRLMLTYDMSGESSLQVRMVGAQLYPDGRAEAVEWVCGGQFHDTDPGEIDAADPQSELTMMMTLSRSKLSIGGDVIYDVDFPQGKVEISGTDQWAEIKAILEG